MTSFRLSSAIQQPMRWLACVSVALILVGCGTTTDRLLSTVGLQRIPSAPPPAPRPPVETIPIFTPAPIPEPAPEAVVEHWGGSYQAILPCPDCEGLRVTLTLFSDATYELRTEAVGAGNVTARGGSFTFNADETRITLDANGQNRMFDILSARALRMLDRNGQPVTGANASRFILRKLP